jgi:hypothetical protein
MGKTNDIFMSLTVTGLVQAIGLFGLPRITPSAVRSCAAKQKAVIKRGANCNEQR